MASEENVAGIIPKMAEAPGLWPEVYRETEKEYVLVASSRHVRLKICKVRFVQSACHVVGRQGLRVCGPVRRSLTRATSRTAVAT